jgi:hypothetical protein
MKCLTVLGVTLSILIPCHPERSEGSLHSKILRRRTPQNDKHFLLPLVLVVDSVGKDVWMPTAGPVPLSFSSDRKWAAAVQADTAYITDMTERLTTSAPLARTWSDSGARVRLVALSPDGSATALYGETKVGYDYLEVLGRHGERLFPAKHVELGMYVNWFFTTGLQVMFVGNFRVSIIELDGDVQHFRTPAAPGAWLRWPYFVLTYGDTGRAFRFVSQPE